MLVHKMAAEKEEKSVLCAEYLVESGKAVILLLLVVMTDEIILGQLVRAPNHKVSLRYASRTI